MNRPTFSQSTKRDFEQIKEAWREFYDDINSPWNLMLLISAMLFAAAMMLLPWLGSAHFE